LLSAVPPEADFARSLRDVNFVPGPDCLVIMYTYHRRATVQYSGGST
jgi:hypothetical protein